MVNAIISVWLPWEKNQDTIQAEAFVSVQLRGAMRVQRESVA